MQVRVMTTHSIVIVYLRVFVTCVSSLGGHLTVVI
jgi:hypothetical protein